MENKRIRGTTYHVSMSGLIFKEDGTILNTRVKNGFHYFIYNYKVYLVHRVVAETFIRPSNHRVRHIDGNKNNNAVWNLEYYKNNFKKY